MGDNNTTPATTKQPTLWQEIESDLKALGSAIEGALETIGKDIVQAFGAGIQTLASSLPGLVLTLAQEEAQAVATALTTPGTDVSKALTAATNTVMTKAAAQGIAAGEAAVSAAISTFAHSIAVQQTGNTSVGS